MTTNEEVAEILKNIDKHIKYIEKKNITNIKQLKNDQDLYLAVSMSIFTLINSLLELGDEIIKNDKLSIPKRYKDIAYSLYENSIINENQQEIFIKLIKIRNNIAHEYETKVKYEDILYSIQNLNFIKEMIKISINKL